ncbi:uncharacterized protein AAEQ78_006382 [Lycaon pictus]
MALLSRVNRFMKGLLDAPAHGRAPAEGEELPGGSARQALQLPRAEGQKCTSHTQLWVDFEGCCAIAEIREEPTCPRHGKSICHSSGQPVEDYIRSAGLLCAGQEMDYRVKIRLPRL